MLTVAQVHVPATDTSTLLNRAFQTEVSMAEYSKYQQNIIKNYYENLSTLQLQKLSEQVTELYLAEGKAREKRWTQIMVLLEKMKIPADRIAHIRKSDNPALLAKLVEELLAKAG
ncbi:MAG: hypothetical protein SFX18_06410 [Pirellulales bacterium]|nr:hypothetical protein [Pirellulales bacterium]